MYGFIISCAVIICLAVALKLVKSKKFYNEDTFWGLSFWSIVGGLVGGRIYHVIDLWEIYSQAPTQIFEFWKGGMGILGVIIGGVIFGIAFLKHLNAIDTLWLDVLGVVLPLGQAIGRWGNFFNQELYGIETSLPWGLHINGASYHPLFLYESLLCSVLFVSLLKVFGSKNVKTGSVFIMYIAGYSMIRFLLEFLRIMPWEISGFNVAQTITAVSFSISLIFLVRTYAKNY